jgi:hypothetical protein
MQDRQGEIMTVYETICRESLSTPIGGKPQFFSRINEDGVPFQIAVPLDSDINTLKFLSEVGVPGSSNLDRIILSRDRIRVLASMLCGKESNEQIDFLLDRIAPTEHPDLVTNPAGAFWMGVRFSENSSPSLQVYINGNWGNETKMWERLDCFAKYFNSCEEWSGAKGLFSKKMKPLGMAITAHRDVPLNGRIYFSSYHNPLSYYKDMIGSFTSDVGKMVFQQFLNLFLADSGQYPMKFIVCSFGLGCSPEPKFKFEICGHCLFKSDIEASYKCFNWAALTKLDPEIYFNVLKIMSGRDICKSKNKVHAFFGFGFYEDKVHSSIYLKPESV